jgi:N-acetylneuraminate synthase
MRVFVIAEIGSVHDGSLGNAIRLIDAAMECGADAVKFQTHIAEAETLRDAPMPSFFTAEPRFEYFRRTAFTLEQWRTLKAHCESKGVKFLSSPFSEAAVDLLEKVEVEIYKIPSGEVTNLPLLDKIARLGKPVLLSSGMSSWEELDRAVAQFRSHNTPLTILQCTSQYPCKYELVGLNVLQEIHDRYGAPVGLSDHTATIYASLAAASLGASVIEKHFTFSRRMYGSDAPHSLEPQEFAEMVQGIRAIEVMLSHRVDKNDVERFRVMKETFEKGVVSVVEIPSGTRFTSEMLAIKKPGTGISAARFAEVIGKRASCSISAGRVLSDRDVIWDE